MYQPEFFQNFPCVFSYIFPRLIILNEENSVKIKSYHVFDSVKLLPQFIRNYPHLHFFRIHPPILFLQFNLHIIESKVPLNKLGEFYLLGAFSFSAILDRRPNRPT